MKRLFWLTFGYTGGLLSSLWVQRRVRRAADRYAPEHLRQAVTARSRDLGDRARRGVLDLRDAVVDGRAAMRDAESRLRTELDGDLAPHSPPARSLAGTRRGYVAGRPRAH